MSIHLTAKLFRGFADPSRLAVLDILTTGRRCVGELVEATGLSQPNLSMHLACLRECGLVRAQRKGRFVHYELADPNVVRLLEAANEILNRVGQRIEVCPRYEVGEGRDGRRGKRKSSQRA